ncbi:hypothetical protein [Pseudonocardia xishanensis]
MTFLSGLARGTAAGAAGTTALNLVSGADAAIRARRSSAVPQRLVGELADRAHVRIPGNPIARSRRLDALGPLAGSLTGLAVGAVAGGLRAAGVRLPGVVGGPLLGAAAMLATDGPAAFAGITDPRTWSTRDWVADAVPHLAYGITTHQTLAALDRGEGAPPPPASVLARAVALGAATGDRSTVGMTALALRTPRSQGGPPSSAAASVAAVTASAGEVVVDKLPVVPSRTGAPGLAPRLGLGALVGATVARRADADPTLPALVGVLAALGSALVGVRWRSWAAERAGSDLPGALAEDAVALGLAWWGSRPTRP